MYKSSPLTFIFRFIFPVFMLIILSVAVYAVWMTRTPESLGIAKAMTTVAIWVGVFLIQLPFRLRYIEAHDKGILIKNFGKENLVAYKDVDWIAWYDLSSPWSVSIKYLDRETGKHKKVSFMPGQKNQTIFGKEMMTEFIKEQIVAVKPNYLRDTHPSTIKNMITGFFVALPVMILVLYFLFGYLISQ